MKRLVIFNAKPPIFVTDPTADTTKLPGRHSPSKTLMFPLFFGTECPSLALIYPNLQLVWVYPTFLDLEAKKFELDKVD